MTSKDFLKVEFYQAGVPCLEEGTLEYCFGSLIGKMDFFFAQLDETVVSSKVLWWRIL